MQLLAALHTAGVSKDAALHLPEVLPRSWPLFRHSLSSVRSACVNCLAALVSASASTNGPDGQHNMSPAIVPSQWLHSGLLATVICLLFQNVLVEETPSIWQASQDTLQRITQQCAAADLQQAFPEALAHSFIRLAAVPGGLPWPADSLDQISKHVSMRLAIAGAPSDYPKDGRGELVADARVAASACLASIAAALPAGEHAELFAEPFQKTSAGIVLVSRLCITAIAFSEANPIVLLLWSGSEEVCSNGLDNGFKTPYPEISWSPCFPWQPA